MINYKEKLNEVKSGYGLKENGITDSDYIEKRINEFCNRQDIIGVRQPDFMKLFDSFCEEKGYLYVNHMFLGRVIYSKWNLTRKKTRGKDGKLYWIYVEKKTNG